MPMPSVLRLAFFASVIEQTCAVRSQVDISADQSEGEQVNETAKSQSLHTVRLGAHLVEQGTIIDGRYKLTSLLWPQEFNTQFPAHMGLGAGNFGAAYLAKVKGTEELVVVKLFFMDEDDHRLLTKANAADSEEAQERLNMAARECKAADDIQTRMPEAAQYPNGPARWMRCLQNGLDNEHAAYVVFEYLGRTNLEEYQEALTNHDMLRIAKEMLEGLALVQGKLVHRDIKAANIMIKKDPDSQELNIWYIDFGFVIDVGAKTSNAGSPNTKAPEAYYSPYVPQSAFDVYSAGATLFQLLCGKTLYDDVCDDIEESDRRRKRDTDEPLMSGDEAMEEAEAYISQNTVDIDSYCAGGIPQDKAALYRFVVDNMLNPDPSQRADARSMLKDPMFANVDTDVMSADFDDAEMETPSEKSHVHARRAANAIRTDLKVKPGKTTNLVRRKIKLSGPMDPIK